MTHPLHTVLIHECLPERTASKRVVLRYCSKVVKNEIGIFSLLMLASNLPGQCGNNAVVVYIGTDQVRKGL